MTEKSLATAATVRTWHVSHPKSFASLSPSAQATITPNAQGQFPKGRLAREAIEVYNKRQSKGEYVDGATRETARAQAKVAKSLRAKAAKRGFVGTRGPLPKAFLATVK